MAKLSGPEVKLLKVIIARYPNAINKEDLGADSMQVITIVIALDAEFVIRRQGGERVVKAVDEAGGYGMLMGPTSTAAERDELVKRHGYSAFNFHE